MVRLVLFDVDGTLISTGGAGLRAFAAVARTTFGRPDGTIGLHFAGRTDPAIIREFFSVCGIAATPGNFERFLDDYAFWLDHYLEETRGQLLPGVREMIRELRVFPSPPVPALLTGNVRLGAELKLRRYGLWQEFALGAFGSDHEDRNQLAVIGRERGSAWLGRCLDGDEILVIGDTPHDIRCAREIGARSLAVATGGIPLPELERHRPTWAVASLAGINVGELCR